MLAEAKSLHEILNNDTLSEFAPMYSGAIVKAVSIIVRDHATEMNEDDLAWCLKLIVQAVLLNVENEDSAAIVDIMNQNGAAAGATVLPMFFDFVREEDEKNSVKEIIAYSLTHANSGVRVATAIGIKEHLWRRDPEFAEICITGAIEYTKFESNDFSITRSHTGKSDDYEEENGQSVLRLTKLREQIVSGEVTTDIESMSFHTHSPWSILNPCLMIPNQSNKPDHIILFSRMLTLLIEAEESERDRDYSKKKDRIEIPHELLTNFTERFADYLISSFDSSLNVFSQELIRGCDAAPELLGGLLLHIEYNTEKMGRKEIYWRLWKHLSEKVQSTAIEIFNKKTQGQNNDYRTKLIRDMLHTDVQWQNADHKSQDIALGKEAILDFVNNAGVNSDVFEAMTSLMYHFPEIFLKPGLLILSKHQKALGGTQLLTGLNTTYYLVRCLQRFLLEETTDAISNQYYQACWILLDVMVEMASSEAYYLREHLIRSRRITK